jgi:hypothetical protein
MRFFALLLVSAGASALDGAQAQQPPDTLSPTLRRAARTPIGPVETEMRNVVYHVDNHVALQIAYLRGTLVMTQPKLPPWFDDPNSFVIAIDTGEVGITPASLSALLNRYVFNYKDSPLKQLRVTIDKGGLKQTGKLHKGIDLPFTIRATLSTTSDGRLQLHPTSVKVAGLSVKGLMELFGLELGKLVQVRQGRGVEIVGNDFLLAPAGLLPAPRIRGRVTRVRIEGDEIKQTFGASERRRPLPRLHPTDAAAPNYMYYQGGILRFGKLTMADADLQIVDADPDDPFDFFLAHLDEQLVAGQSRNQVDYGLLTIMPDYSDLGDRHPTRTRRK